MPPVNDNFANAIDVGASPFSVSGSNTGATFEAGEPDGTYGQVTVWWTWTADLSGSFEVNTQGSNFDTVLDIYEGAWGSLTSVGHNDDYYGSQSRVVFTASAGTTYYIRVDGYSSTDVGTVNLNGLLPGAPHITSTSPTQGAAGTAVTLTGTNFTGTTSVTFGGVAATFTVVSGTQITTTVPTGVSPGPIVVTNGVGAGSHLFTTLFPGPWVQPGDTWSAWLAGFQQGQYGRTDTVAASPGTAPNPVGSPQNVGYAFDKIAAVADGMGNLTGWTWEQQIGVYACDYSRSLNSPGNATDLPPVAPSSSELSQPHVITWEAENPGGTGLGPLEVQRHIEIDTEARDDTTKTASTSTSDVFGKHIEIRRLAAGSYTWNGSYTASALSPDQWPSNLASLPVVHTVPVAVNSDITLATSLFPNDWADAHHDDGVQTDSLNISDLDTGQKLGYVVVIDTHTGAGQLTQPTIANTAGGVAGQNKDVHLYTSPRFQTRIYYRPPRYRLLYDFPQQAHGQPPPLRQTQRGTGLVGYAAPPLRQTQNQARSGDRPPLRQAQNSP